MTIFGIVIMRAKKRNGNINYQARILAERNRFYRKVCSLECTAANLRAKCEKYTEHAKSMREIIEEKDRRFRKLSKRCTHLEHELEKLEQELKGQKQP